MNKSRHTGPKDFPHSHICDVCAEERGGKHPGGIGTVMEGTCKYCNGKKQIGKVITPWIDYDWPSPARTAFARAARD